MPIYEYTCKGCGEEFEVLVNRSTVPECPKCHSKELEKKFSTFSAKGGSAPSGGGHKHGPGCGCCCGGGGPGGGMCHMN